MQMSFIENDYKIIKLQLAQPVTKISLILQSFTSIKVTDALANISTLSLN